jgi:hypothetical protein
VGISDRPHFAWLRGAIERFEEGSRLLATYIDALRADLERADGHMVRPEVMEEFFKVAYRDARYFHRFKGTFYLHLLTVLRPAGT